MTSGPDIVVGVAGAADAGKQRLAAARLERLSREIGNVAAADAASSPSADAPLAWPAEVRLAEVNTPRPPAGSTAQHAPDRSQTPDAYVQFEALLLQNMIETMMPEDSKAMFGSGTAGMIWKSMLAEKVAAEIARTGTLGIARQIAEGEAVRSAAAAPAKVDGA